jgi:hypothetical protein
MAFWMYSDANLATGMNYWVNNTINYANGAGGEGDSALFMRYTDPGYWTFKNNIIVAPAAVNTYSNGTTKNTFDHNNYYNTESYPFTYYTADKTFTQWKALSANFDNIGSFVADPKLGTDSALTANSPGRNAGTPVEGITVISGVGQPGIDGKAFDPTHPSMGASQYQSQAYLYGDVSGDSSISAYDASLAAQYAVGLITLTSTQIQKADVTGDSSVSAYDASLIAQKAVGLITKFPVEG